MTNKEAIEKLFAMKKCGGLTNEHRQALNLAIKKLEEKQTGKWIVTQEGRWLYPICSLCGSKQDVKSNYCPDCGARMKDDYMEGYKEGYSKGYAQCIDDKEMKGEKE